MDLSGVPIEQLLSAAQGGGGIESATPEQLLEAAGLSQPEVSNEGAPALERIASSFLSDPKAQLAYFKSRHEDARVGPSGVEFKQGGQWHRVNPRGLDWGDIASFAGDVPEIAGSVAGGIAGSAVGPAGTVGGAAAGAGIGNALKQ